MDRAGDLLFARARFADDQNRTCGFRNVPDQLEHIVHLRAFAQHILERVATLELCAEAGDFVPESPFFERPLHDDAEFVRVGGLGDEVVGPVLHRRDGFFNRSVAGGYDHRDGDFPGLDLLQELHAAELGHLEVGDDQAVRLLLEHLQAFGSILGRVHFESEGGLE